MKQSTGLKGFTTIILLLVILGLVFFTYLSNRKSKSPEATTSSETQQLLNYDFENNYPKTPRETVKLHCDYLKNIYGDKYKFTEEDLHTINQNIRKLFDMELLAINTEDEQLQKMKDEMLLYKENKQKLISYSLPEGSQVEYNTEGDTEYAKLKVTLNLRIGSAAASAEEEYILRKDSMGQWKILGWQAISDTSSENEGEMTK